MGSTADHSETTHSGVDRVWRLNLPLQLLRPEATALLDEVNARAWTVVEPLLLELVRLRTAALIGNTYGLQRRSTTAASSGLSEQHIIALDNYSNSDDFTDLDKDFLGFAEQFVIDVSSMSAANVSPLLTHVDAPQVRGFVMALYVTEFTQRLELMSTALLGEPTSDPVTNETVRGVARPGDVEGLHQSLRDYQDAVVRGTAIDPTLTELVRLRCARTHNCRICQTLRLAAAFQAGVDDDMTAKVDRYEKSDLPERTKLALRITDAFLTRPDTLSAESIQQARKVFSPEELAELCLDITKWSTQKIHVSLGTDGAERLQKNAQGISYFSFDADGRVAGYATTVTAAHP
jgi:alkylhydroperoxidase family enzyme